MLKIRYILLLLIGLCAIQIKATTSLIKRSELISRFNNSNHSVSWEESRVTFTLSGPNNAIFTYGGSSFYLSTGPGSHTILPVGSNDGITYTLSWSVEEDYDIKVENVTINVDRASGKNSYITVGDVRTGDLFSSFFSIDLSSGTRVYTTYESIPVYFEKAWTYSQVDVNSITITYTIIPKFIFLGNGGGGESEQLKWDRKENWLPGDKLPSITDSVFIRHDVTITGDATAKNVTIEGSNKVTIAPTGNLKVGAGGVKNATPDNFKLQAATTGGNQGQTGVLLIDPACTTMPSATAEMYSKAYFDMTVDDRNNVGSYQYVGSPMVAGTAAKAIFPNSWVYNWDEASGKWKNNRKTLTLQPFEGYCTSQYLSNAGIMIEHKGQLASNGNQVLNLSYTATSAEPGINVLANSYTAPIDIKQFVDGDFSGVDATIYLFNTGSKNDVKDHPELNGDLAGQFIAIPIHQAGEMVGSFRLPAVIPAMQGFYVKANSAGSTLALDYERLVWNATHSNKPLRARRADEQKKGSLCVTVEADGWRDQVFLLEAEEYDVAFENGYDAHKLMQGNLNIFTIEGEDALAVDATNRIAGTKIGVRTGEETAYTLRFGSVSGETDWSLYDAQAQETIAIEEGMQYTFFAEPNSEIRDRFYITERNDAPAITTDLENVVDGADSRKFIKEGRLFVIKNGMIYNMLGVVVSR